MINSNKKVFYRISYPHFFTEMLLIGVCILFNTIEKNYAQQSSFQFKHLKPPTGNLENFINGITQDSIGFIWISSWDGLFRYDGRVFTKYGQNPSDPASLSANWTEDVFVDREGTLWVGTYGGGLNRFDAETETFTHFRNQPGDPHSLSQDSVTAILEDRFGDLWIGTMGGLNRMDRKTGKFIRYLYDPHDSTSLGNDQVRAIFEDSQGTLWLGTNSPFGNERDNPGPGGLNRLNRETGTFERYLHDPDDPSSLASNHVMSIYEDSRGTLWVGTWNNGLHAMNRQKGTFKRYPYNPNAPEDFSTSNRNLHVGDEGGTIFIHEDKEGILWIGNYGHGLFRFNPDMQEFIQFDDKANDLESPSLNTLWRMFQSTDGTQWIGLNPGGIFQVFQVEELFEHYTLTPMHTSNFMNVLAIDSSGMLRVNACCPQNTTVNFQPVKDGDRSYRAISSFSTDG